jgi:hypothetical protein
MINNLHIFLDFDYRPDGDVVPLRSTANRANTELRFDNFSETYFTLWPKDTGLRLVKFL